MHDYVIRAISVTLGCCVLGGCGTYVPDIAEFGDKNIEENQIGKNPKITATAQIEYEIREKIFCSLQRGLALANKLPVSEAPDRNAKFHTVTPSLFPSDWAAQVALSLEVDETSALNPGVVVNEVLPNAVHVFGPGSTGTVNSAQSFSFGFGGTASSTSTRIDKFNNYWTIKDLSQPMSRTSSCYPQYDPFVLAHVTPATSSPLIQNELGIEDWLVGTMLVDRLVPQSSVSKPESLSIEIKFVIVTNGNVTPTWKLVRVSANTGGAPLVNMGRTRTHDLIITLGPDSTQTNNSHLASQIGNAVSQANRAAAAQ